MSSFDKVLFQVLRGASDTNIRFGDLRFLFLGLDFTESIRGSHHIFRRDDVEEIVTLQPRGWRAH